MTLFVGVDGGATASTAVVADADGRLVARVRGGAAMVRASEPLAGVARLAELVRAALAEAGGSPPVDGLCCALAGVGREAERSAVEAALAGTGVARRVRVVTDAEAALYDAFGDASGIVVVAGTGSVAWGRAPDGRVGRAGGWGAQLGDEGSGYALGLDALRAVLRAHDGRLKPTTLTGALLREVGVQQAEGLIAWTETATKAGIAALAPAVFDAAERGDSVAYGILERAASELAQLAAALYRTLGPWDRDPDVACAGSLIASQGRLREVFARALVGTALPFQILRMEVDAARGAAGIAQRAE